MKNLTFNSIALLLFAGAAIYLTSCAPAYVPNALNTPLFNNKGEIHIAANTGISGFDPQVAYAVTDNIGVMVNGSFRDYTSDSTDDFHRHSFVEGGVGYTYQLENIVKFEVYGGYGYGQLQAYFDNTLWSNYSDVRCHRIFIQPAIGASSKFFDASFAMRFASVNLRQEGMHETGYFVEPALTIKLGYKYVKGIMQGGLSYPFNSDNINFNYQPFIFSIGLQATLKRNYD